MGAAGTSFVGGLFWGVIHAFENLGFVAICVVIAVGFLISAAKGDDPD